MAVQRADGPASPSSHPGNKGSGNEALSQLCTVCRYGFDRLDDEWVDWFLSLADSHDVQLLSPCVPLSTLTCRHRRHDGVFVT